MKIRFSKTDVIDTKNIEGGGADVSELEGAVSSLTETVTSLSTNGLLQSLVDACVQRGDVEGFEINSDGQITATISDGV